MGKQIRYRSLPAIYDKNAFLRGVLKIRGRSLHAIYDKNTFWG